MLRSASQPKVNRYLHERNISDIPERTNLMNENDPILCYVEGNFAYFTSKPLEETSGDDWDDAPYEHNAEPPFGTPSFGRFDNFEQEQRNM